MSEMQRRLDGRKLLARRSQITKRIEVEAPTRVRNGVMAIVIKGARG